MKYDCVHSNFTIPKKSAVISSIFILQKEEPILYVSHEYDEKEGTIWQFHCGNGDFSMDKMVLVSLENILRLDETINQISNLPSGYQAMRKSVDEKWIISSIKDGIYQ